MNKQELIRKIAAASEVTQREASIMLDNTIEIIMDTVASGEKVQLIGFGTFEKKHRSARTAINPRTLEKVEVPATTVPYFHPGTIFKEKAGR